MVTLEELRAIPLFDSLTEEQLAQLARTLPDIHLRAGEYAVHEGQGRALIIPIEGRLEVTKTLDGVERVIGVRASGELFGEVPMALNTPFLASVRAAEPSRVIRIEAKEYHGLAALAPAISAVLGAAALDRIEGLQDIAAEPPAPALRCPRSALGCYVSRAARFPFEQSRPVRLGHDRGWKPRDRRTAGRPGARRAVAARPGGRRGSGVQAGARGV